MRPLQFIELDHCNHFAFNQDSDHSRFWRIDHPAFDVKTRYGERAGIGVGHLLPLAGCDE